MVSWFGWWRGFNKSARRCAKCGFAIEVDESGARARLKINPEVWADRCTERGEGMQSPFQCPHLKAAARRIAAS